MRTCEGAMPPYKRVAIGSSKVGTFDFSNLSPKHSRKKKNLKLAMNDISTDAESKDIGTLPCSSSGSYNSKKDRQQPTLDKYRPSGKSYKRYISDTQRLPLSSLGRDQSRGDHMNQVLRSLYIGNKEDAQASSMLKQMGITHVVNATDSLPNYYNHRLKYHQVPVKDSPDANIAQFFDETLKFIREAIKSGGVCLVHCVAGCSRSATIVIAYLVCNERLLLKDAYDYARKRRDSVQPNNGFMFQLAEYEIRIHAGSSVVSADAWNFYEWNIRKESIPPSQQLKAKGLSSSGKSSSLSKSAGDSDSETCCIVS